MSLLGYKIVGCKLFTEVVVFYGELLNTSGLLHIMQVMFQYARLVASEAAKVYMYYVDMYRTLGLQIFYLQKTRKRVLPFNSLSSLIVATLVLQGGIRR